MVTALRATMRRTTLLLALSTATAASAQVGPNDVALGKTATQSSTWNSINPAGKAVDGLINGGVYGPFMSVTNNDDLFGWWLVDLGGSFDVTSITLWNRTDCCATRLNDFFVSILADGVSNPQSAVAPTVFTDHVTSVVGVSETFTPVSGTIGRYVKVQYDGRPRGDNFLQLAEVDVEGSASRVVSVTPEPATLSLLLLPGLALVIGAERRRRRS